MTNVLSVLYAFFLMNEILSHASAKKKTKRLNRFKFRAFMGRFSSDIMAVKELIPFTETKNFTESSEE